jgi:glutamate/tyrosine decarboxylase-like PLP-dependent enzyme
MKIYRPTRRCRPLADALTWTAVYPLTSMHASHSRPSNCELAIEPFLNALLFRYRPDGVPEAVLDAVNGTIRSRLLVSGQALLARTKFSGRVFLKVTLLNPRTERHHIESILTRVKQAGDEALRNLS